MECLDIPVDIGAAGAGVALIPGKNAKHTKNTH